MNPEPAPARRGRIAENLVADVDLLSLDAGNTIVFFDHARLAQLCAAHGFDVAADALNRAEGETKIAQEEGTLVASPWPSARTASERSWAGYIGTMLSRAGVPARALASLLDAAWLEHRRRNLWCLVPDGLADALAWARSTGMCVVVVSNSEGELEPFLRALGLAHSFDLVIDSARVGFEKPDPRIFRVALDRFGVPPGRALHLGDIYATDVLGARAAGLRAALIDPYGHLTGRHPDVPRVTGAVAVALGAAAERRARGSAGRGA